MKKLTSVKDVASLGSILSVWAHPDDETFCAGGLMAVARRNGQRVVCITATKGESGVQDTVRWPIARLGEIRAAELQNALKILGINEHHWLGYKDGQCLKVADEEVLPRIIGYIEKYQPDTILTFAADGMTGHPDHQTVSRWVKLATAQLKNPPKVYQVATVREQYDAYLQQLDKRCNLYFMIDRPSTTPARECDICLKLPAEAASLKYQALKSMQSQTDLMFKSFPRPWLEAMLAVEAFRADPRLI